MSCVCTVDGELRGGGAVKGDDVRADDHAIQGVLDCLHVLSIEAAGRIESIPGERSTSDLILNVSNLASHDHFDCEEVKQCVGVAAVLCLQLKVLVAYFRSI